MAEAVTLAILLVLATSFFHYSVLGALSRRMSGFTSTTEIRILVVLLVTLLAHIVEILLYAVAYLIAVEVFSVGAFGGVGVEEFHDYLYFSIVSYTSLGLGDVFPSGHLRFITGIEALNGLLLIAWSGSFIYIVMGRFWPLSRCALPVAAHSGSE